jgi:hypothetical protein
MANWSLPPVALVIPITQLSESCRQRAGTLSASLLLVIHCQSPVSHSVRTIVWSSLAPEIEDGVYSESRRVQQKVRSSFLLLNPSTDGQDTSQSHVTSGRILGWCLNVPGRPMGTSSPQHQETRQSNYGNRIRIPNGLQSQLPS